MKSTINNKIIFLFFIGVFSLVLVNPAYSQEPGPPFPEESDTEKIQRLTKENTQLKEENLRLQIQVNELNKIIENLQAITLEQIKVIMQLVQQLQEAIFAISSSLEINV